MTPLSRGFAVTATVVRYSRNGSMEVALDENAADALAHEAATLTRDGIAHR